MITSMVVANPMISFEIPVTIFYSAAAVVTISKGARAATFSTARAEKTSSWEAPIATF